MYIFGISKNNVDSTTLARPTPQRRIFSIRVKRRNLMNNIEDVCALRMRRTFFPLAVMNTCTRRSVVTARTFVCCRKSVVLRSMSHLWRGSCVRVFVSQRSTFFLRLFHRFSSAGVGFQLQTQKSLSFQDATKIIRRKRSRNENVLVWREMRRRKNDASNKENYFQWSHRERTFHCVEEEEKTVDR